MSTPTVLAIALLLAAAPATAFDGSQKEGPPAPYFPTPHIDVIGIRADLVFNTAGGEDAAPITGGTHDAWGHYFATIYHNDSAEELHITEFGFPCGGLGPVDWIFSTIAPADEAPPAPEAADQSGSFNPVDFNAEANPPLNYTFVDVSDLMLMVPAGGYFAFGYENPGMGGMVLYNDVDTWAWFDALPPHDFTWEPDALYFRTAVLQFKADFVTPVVASTFGTIKRLY